jgi:hypothetical protein
MHCISEVHIENYSWINVACKGRVGQEIDSHIVIKKRPLFFNAICKIIKDDIDQDVKQKKRVDLVIVTNLKALGEKVMFYFKQILPKHFNLIIVASEEGVAVEYALTGQDISHYNALTNLEKEIISEIMRRGVKNSKTFPQTEIDYYKHMMDGINISPIEFARCFIDFKKIPVIGAVVNKFIKCCPINAFVMRYSLLPRNANRRLSNSVIVTPRQD